MNRQEKVKRLCSGKIAAMLSFHENIALHITRGVRWDSDHVVLFDDETREIAKDYPEYVPPWLG